MAVIPSPAAAAAAQCGATRHDPRPAAIVVARLGVGQGRVGGGVCAFGRGGGRECSRCMGRWWWGEGGGRLRGTAPAPRCTTAMLCAHMTTGGNSTCRQQHTHAQVQAGMAAAVEARTRAEVPASVWRLAAATSRDSSTSSSEVKRPPGFTTDTWPQLADVAPELVEQVAASS